MSAKMQEKKLCEGQELICINVDKVYDWIVKEMSFDVTPIGAIAFTPTVPAGTSFAGAIVTCEVTPDPTTPVVILGRENRVFCIDGENVVLQQLNIRKNFVVRLIVTLPNGLVFTSVLPTAAVNPTLLISRCEQITLCAPEGTDVSITFTDIDCFVCSPGTLSTPPTGGTPTSGTITFTGLTIAVTTCQSIQSTFPVTVEFLADFCEPREELPTACPAPLRPKQCHAIFPDDGHGNCCH
ncbi:hypothetical protein [Sporosarcina sp. JAI121]|uniref:hypothetical protein n=1 Tax=Sporosarcina sp. JAI121 TaxID=2723064 RepID=UPI003519EF12